MKIRITGPGIFGGEGELPIGTEFDVNGPLFDGWAGKYEILQDKPAKDAKAVINPAEKD